MARLKTPAGSNKLSEVFVEIKFPDWILKSQKLARELPLLIAATVQTQRGMIFNAEGAYNGRPKWEPLKFRQGQILSDRGTLRKSISPRTNGLTPGRATGSILKISTNLVTVGTEIAYASVHNEGAVIKPKGGKLLVFPVPVYNLKGKKTGERLIFAKKVTIPKREFGNMNDADMTELNETVANFYQAVI